MYKVVRRKALRPTVTQLEIEAPLVARKAKPGQFIILRVNEEGERIPLTVAGTNPEEGTVKIIFQVVGATTELLNHVPEGGYLQDFVGPLGNATETEGIKKVCIVGGGAKNEFLNRLTEEATGKKVVALPLEATAIGNLKIQMEVTP